MTDRFHLKQKLLQMAIGFRHGLIQILHAFSIITFALVEFDPRTGENLAFPTLENRPNES